jgi:hypothetical protein
MFVSNLYLDKEIMLDEGARTEEFYEISTFCETSKFRCRVNKHLALGPKLNK